MHRRHLGCWFSRARLFHFSTTDHRSNNSHHPIYRTADVYYLLPLVYLCTCTREIQVVRHFSAGTALGPSYPINETAIYFSSTFLNPFARICGKRDKSTEVRTLHRG